MTQPATKIRPEHQLLEKWLFDPVLFVEMALGAEPSAWHREALKAIVEHDRIAIRSARGVGKSTYLAWLILWFLLTRYPAKILCTAPSAHQLEDILWSEVRLWHRRLPKFFQDEIRVTADKVELTRNPGESFAAARTARRESPEALQGFHAEHMLILADEASGIDDIIFQTGEGSMSTPGAKVVMTGNPTRVSGYFYNAFHRMRHRWKTIKVSLFDVKDQPWVSMTVEEDLRKMYGVNSDTYRVQILGEFPQSEAASVIPANLIESALARHGAVHPIRSYRVVWGLDVARFGDDNTALAKRRANVLLEPVTHWHGKDLMQTCGLVKAEYERLARYEDDLLPSEILVDSIGLGAGVVDRLHELGLPVRGINVGESASVKERYMRFRDELWFRGREWFQELDVSIPEDEQLIAELQAPTFNLTSTGKIIVESKADLKARGLPSPDLADAFLLTFAGGLDRMPNEQLDRYRRKSRQSGGWMTA